MPLKRTLYDIDAASVDFALVRQFVLEHEAANLLSEGLTWEIKARRSGNNVAEAVAALANADGGLVLVGVAESGVEGERRLAGVARGEVDSLVSHLHNLLPTAMPEVIPVAIPDTDKVIIVLRIDADAVAHPVIVAGKVVYRVPG